ncbi:MAG: cellulase family glycosylhydrolase [Actinomycetota bacterium]|nr:cellulase family glycosylhydrolase [Actinomycetota bacterium]
MKHAAAGRWPIAAGLLATSLLGAACGEVTDTPSPPGPTVTTMVPGPTVVPTTDAPTTDTTVPTDTTSPGTPSTDTTIPTDISVPDTTVPETTVPTDTTVPETTVPTSTPGCDGERPEGNDGAGFFVDTGAIYDPNGCEFVPMGFNGAVFWNVTVGGSKGAHGDLHTASLADMSAAGANTVRINSQTAGAFGWNANPGTQRELVQAAVDADLVPILEMHDATCSNGSIDAVLDYWTTPEMVALAQDFDDSLWINLANEHTFSSPEEWRDTYRATITELRSLGVTNPIVLDSGANCGQNPESFLLYGQDVLESDPMHNVILSIHMYGFWRTGPGSGEGFTPPNEVGEQLAALRDTGVPIIIGEFGWDEPAADDVPYDAATVVETAQDLGIGWTYWAWYTDTANHRAVTGLDQPGSPTAAGSYLLPYLEANAAKATNL